MNYEKEEIVETTTVAGNIRDFTQSYKILFYPQAKDLPSKIALYIYLDSADKSFAKRSIYFSSTEQLKTLIFDLTKAYFYFRDKKNKPIQQEIWRTANIDNFLYELRKRQMKLWAEGTVKSENPKQNEP